MASEKVCENCGGDWVGTACLDCGATLGMIADAAERPGGPAALLLNMLRHSAKERGKQIRPRLRIVDD